MQRNTIQRSLTLKAVQTLRCHPTAEQVYNAIKETCPSISKGTVYRNLNQLAESGHIQKIELTDGAAHFDHRCHKHYHVTCLACGRVFDADVALPDLERFIQNSHGFQFLGYDLMFKGICPACSASSQHSDTTENPTP
ncbi:MAG: transcriptional repressor [Evtepia sp.]|uniref:Fur family transcriptional regulator n=1 Tax=Evtepia sp. TaxID=2773933 RepID=UPI002A765275|nr:transcriptional repressor [Evtepia sp.]MDY3015227.1 transcriptional repressor [Evtepia sp.]